MAACPGKPSVALLGDEALSASQKLQWRPTASPNQGTLTGCTPQITRKKTNDPKDLHSNSLAPFYLFSPRESLVPSMFPKRNPELLTQDECFLLKWWVLALAPGPFLPLEKEGYSDLIWWSTRYLWFPLISVSGNQSCCIWSMGKCGNCRSITPLSS